MVVLGRRWLLRLSSGRRHETRGQLSDKLAGRVLTSSAAAAVTSSLTTAEELTREATETSKWAGALTATTAMTTATAGMLTEECIHCHAT